MPQVRAMLPHGIGLGAPAPNTQARMSAALIPSVVAASDLVARVPSSLPNSTISDGPTSLHAFLAAIR